ncbi:MAG: hypothetical protein ACE5H9_08085 [Anaerolineae bacterium]
MYTETKSAPLALTRGIVDYLILTYAFPAERLAAMLPPGRQPARQGRWGLVVASFATIQVPFPDRPGLDTFRIQYGIVSRPSPRPDGLHPEIYLIRGETDFRLMERYDRLLIHYRLQAPSFLKELNQGILSLFLSGTPGHADARIEVDLTTPRAGLPAGSPFSSVAEARRFFEPVLGLTPVCGNVVLGMPGPGIDFRPVFVLGQQVQYIEDGPFGDEGRLAGAFYLTELEHRSTAGCQIPLHAYN